MTIQWHGHSCFQITTQKAKNSQVTILTDPFDDSVGLKIPKISSDIVLVSHSHHDHNNTKGLNKEAFIIDSPGEYEIKDIFIQGIFSYHDEEKGVKRGNNTIYTIEAEELKLCHLGDFGEKELSNTQLESIGDIDVLMIPIGGVYTLDAQGASRVISQIEPRIVIPMHYHLPKLKIKLDSIDKFLKIMGIKKPEEVKKFVLKKKDLSQEEMNIVLMSL